MLFSNEDLRASEAREALALGKLLGIPAEDLKVTILPQITFAERREARAVARGELFFPQASGQSTQQ